MSTFRSIFLSYSFLVTFPTRPYHSWNASFSSYSSFLLFFCVSVGGGGGVVPAHTEIPLSHVITPGRWEATCVQKSRISARRLMIKPDIICSLSRVLHRSTHLAIPTQ